MGAQHTQGRASLDLKEVAYELFADGYLLGIEHLAEFLLAGVEIERAIELARANAATVGARAAIAKATQS
jgi:hypothetical protein